MKGLELSSTKKLHNWQDKTKQITQFLKFPNFSEPDGKAIKLSSAKITIFSTIRQETYLLTHLKMVVGGHPINIINGTIP